MQEHINLRCDRASHHQMLASLFDVLENLTSKLLALVFFRAIGGRLHKGWQAGVYSNGVKNADEHDLPHISPCHPAGGKTLLQVIAYTPRIKGGRNDGKMDRGGSSEVRSARPPAAAAAAVAPVTAAALA